MDYNQESQNTNAPAAQEAAQPHHSAAPTTPTAPKGSLKRSVWLGLKFHLADAGISIIAGIAFGLSIAALGLAGNQIVLLVVGAGLGLIVSAYAAFSLYRVASKEMYALVALAGWGIALSALDILSTQSATSAGIERASLLIALQVGGYVGGWYIAKNTNLKLPALRGALLHIAVALGVVLLFFTILGALSVVRA